MTRLLFAAAVLIAAAAARAATLEIRSDARVDLVGLVQQLADADPIDGPVPAFRREALERFAPFKSHPAVLHLKEMSARGFGRISAAQFILYFDEPPGLKKVWTPPEHFAREAGGAAELERFAGELRDFAAKSGFADWYASRSTDTAALVSELREATAGTDLETPLVRYLGVASWEKWVIVPSWFYPEGVRSSWVVEEKPGLPHVYAVIGPATKRARRFPAASSVAEQVWPEAIYSTAYFMYELCRPALNLRESVCDEVPGYQGAGNCLEILWVQATVARLLGSTFGPAAAKDFAGRTMRMSRKATEKVSALLEEYEKNRERYPRLVDFTTRLAAPFSSGPGECRLVDRARFSSEEYALQLGVYLDARLAVEKNPELEAARAELRKPR